MPKRAAEPEAKTSPPKLRRDLPDDAVLVPDTPIETWPAPSNPLTRRPSAWLDVRMCGRPLTKRAFAAICAHIAANPLFAGATLVPERASEGGIELLDAANPRAYKSVRFSGNPLWPWITKKTRRNWAALWPSNNDMLMPHQSGPLSLCCKSNYYATPWTRAELDVVLSAFAHSEIFANAAVKSCV